MLFKELGKDTLSKLLEEATKKLSLQTDRDSKLLSEMNNTLNWIVTLMAVLLATGINYFKNIEHNSSYEFDLIYLSRCTFVLCIVILVIHKVVLVRYESLKFEYINTLNTHELELKFNIEALQKKLDPDETLIISNFINDFRNGFFVPLGELDERPARFSVIDKWLKRYGKILQTTFILSVVLFTIDFSITFYLLLK